MLRDHGPPLEPESNLPVPLYEGAPIMTPTKIYRAPEPMPPEVRTELDVMEMAKQLSVAPTYFGPEGGWGLGLLGGRLALE